MTRLIAPLVAAAAISVAGSTVAAELIIDTPTEPVPVAEAGDWYVSLFAGGVWTSDVDTVYVDGSETHDVSVGFGPGYTLGIAVGTHVFENLRGEVELSFGRVEASSFILDDDPEENAQGPLSTTYLLGNLWYELGTGSGFTPYLGGGIGAGYATGDVTFDGYSRGYGPGGVGFAYQLGFGVTVDVADNIALDFGYRYKSILDIDFEDNDGGGAVYEGGDVNSHVVQAGLKVSF